MRSTLGEKYTSRCSTSYVVSTTCAFLSLPTSFTASVRASMSTVPATARAALTFAAVSCHQVLLQQRSLMQAKQRHTAAFTASGVYWIAAEQMPKASRSSRLDTRCSMPYHWQFPER